MLAYLAKRIHRRGLGFGNGNTVFLPPFGNNTCNTHRSRAVALAEKLGGAR